MERKNRPRDKDGCEYHFPTNSLRLVVVVQQGWEDGAREESPEFPNANNRQFKGEMRAIIFIKEENHSAYSLERNKSLLFPAFMDLGVF